jgi:hypothetical protein
MTAKPDAFSSQSGRGLDRSISAWQQYFDIGWANAFCLIANLPKTK